MCVLADIAECLRADICKHNWPSNCTAVAADAAATHILQHTKSPVYGMVATRMLLSIKLGGQALLVSVEC